MRRRRASDGLAGQRLPAPAARALGPRAGPDALRTAALALAAALASAGCLAPFSAAGPYACGAGDSCPAGFTCDDGLCCVVGGSPACPTLPTGTACPSGATPQVLYEDLDGDGFGNARAASLRCARPQRTRWVDAPGDCDDGDASMRPGAAEACNGKDDSCDGRIDEGLSPRVTFFRDVDGDGFGDTADTLDACQAPVGYVAQALDCDPFDASRHPGAPERCNGLDDDCDGAVDEGPFVDSWNPGDAEALFACDTGQPGLCAAGNQRCVVGPGGSARQCVQRYAPAAEVCDGVDDDCDGQVDEQPACGGPRSIAALGGAVAGALRLPSGPVSPFNSVCPTDWAADAGVGTAMSWASPTWSFSATADAYQVFWLAPASGTWDLSAKDLSLLLEFDATFAGSAGWGAATRFRNPVVYLCGEQPGLIVRYVKGVLQDTATSVAERIPLAGGNGWVVGFGSGFDTRRVKRVEIFVWPTPPTDAGAAASFTVTFSADAGFAKP